MVIGILVLVFLTSLYIVCDFISARHFNAISDAINASTWCTPDNLTGIPGFVHLHVTSPPYSVAYNPLVNYSVPGTAVRFRPEYCQCVQTVRPGRFFVPGPFPKYHTIWNDTLIPDGDFVDRNYRRNPTELLPSFFTLMPINLPNLTISELLFEPLEDASFSEYFHMPEPQDLASFNHSQFAELGFQYIGRGYYFRSGTQDLESRMSRIRRANPTADQDQLVDLLMANCKVGDVRVRNEVFSPDCLTIFGFHDRGNISCGSVKTIRVGGIAAGVLTPSELLLQRISYREQWSVAAQRFVTGFLLCFLWFSTALNYRALWLVGVALVLAVGRAFVWRGFEWFTRFIERFTAALSDEL
jgi:hypothetical protein